MLSSWSSSLLLLSGLFAATARAIEVQLDQTEDNRQKCQGMYDRNDWGGPVDPFILAEFPNITVEGDADPIVSLIIFEWKDEWLIGADANSNELICDPENVANGLCEEGDIGKWILAKNATDKAVNPILTQAIHLKSSSPINYPIKRTGYYCVAAYGYRADEFMGVVEFREAYGELPATQIPKLPFYGGITILYAIVAAFWGFLYYQHRYDILPVQNYITAILVFLVVEMLMTWGFYDFLNRHGSNVGAKVLLVVVAVLNAFRNSFSFFLLLIVCMGYGVVKPSLGPTMVYVRWLAIAHFVFGLAYAVTSLVLPPDAASPFLLFVVLPLAGTLTAFYVWTLNSLNFTLKDLRERKQHVKEGMYKKLWWCILVSILVIFGFFFFNSFTFASATSPDFVPFHWKSRWFVLDGWLNLVYFADVAWIAYVWRPTANNRRFAMSDEIAQDENGEFEFADIGAPDDSDDEEANVGTKPPVISTAATQSAPNGASASAGGSGAASSSRGAPQRVADSPRDSFEDGETIFAVGEDGDKFSDDDDDDDDDSGDDTKLIKKK
ncbi:lung seven transmembrane receptor-domain-containing protein [Microdochium trichocladiopsis]|uniref:Lung seven transmembrane receptor-domain-containing protein n=1 Tax=Microdochium trichocladiopsis TaxID=1682393 RepID=A0A9P9BU85_9PEZI|nr:lung seven transmembrane receptor-domain-containing protein [Microdochium trichocladiopsis]KAH7037842.1 lung seven transmembrane receptor-domain-containing protein [Microdochium trichocladiopsis]